MPSVRFGRKDEPATVLNETDEFIAVRTTRPVARRSPPVLGPLELELPDAALVVSFPEANVGVYRVRQTPGTTYLSTKAAIEGHQDVRFAGRVLVDEVGDPVVYTENLFVKFADDVPEERCLATIAEHELELKRKVDYAINAFFASADGAGRRIFEIAERLLEREDVEFAHPEIIRQRVAKATFPQQWHLADATVNGVAVSAHANVAAAHQISTGCGVTIAIIDDGVDVDHPEFADKIVAPRDASLDSDDPRPKDPSLFYPDNHGTACAGVACASGAHGASGVAPDAKLMPIRLSSALGSEQEAQAFQWASDHGADIISCSWGPPDGRWNKPDDPAHTTPWPIPASTRLAIDYANSRGRGGLGCVILFAAGNGNEDVRYDGYASYQGVIAIAACNDRGVRSCYSDYGDAVWCSFPSNDFEHASSGRPAPLTKGIWTTDRVGAAGYNPGRAGVDLDGLYTDNFGGTSSACPGVAGVVALMLAQRPGLTRDEIKDVLRRTSQLIDEENGGYDDRGWSRLYGWGRVDAAKALSALQDT